MFALESLSLAGEMYNNSASVRKACEFLVKHQMEDGGWGETYMVRLASQHTGVVRADFSGGVVVRHERVFAA